MLKLSPLQELALSRGLKLEDLNALAPTDPPRKSANEVSMGPELRRILILPRRPPTSGSKEAHELAVWLTELFQRHPHPYPVGTQYPNGTGYLNALQATGLQEAWAGKRGAFLPLPPGWGKTLLAYLLPTVLQKKRPLYMAPGGLLEQGKAEFRKYAQHWKGMHPDAFQYLSYQTLSRKNAGVQYDDRKRVIREAKLDLLAPDIIICDEAHAFKNKSASCTRKYKDFRKTHPDVPMVFMTGTPGREVAHLSHLLEWCLGKDHCPLPTDFHELMTWNSALGANSFLGPATGIGALREFCTEEERAELEGAEEETQRTIARSAVGRRIRETPGVVGIEGGELDVPLSICAVFPEQEDLKISEMFAQVRSRWALPDDEIIADGVSLARHLNTMGLGYWTRWAAPRPPEYWMEARKAWNSWVRERVQSNRSGWYSEEAIKDVVRKGILDDFGLLAMWEEARRQYKVETNLDGPLTEEVVFSTEVVDFTRKWTADHPAGIVWVLNVAFGARLARELGTSFYGESGLDAGGRFVADHPHNTPMVVSFTANRTGRNLQHGWHENLWLGCAPEEQALARCHRSGQLRPVSNYVYFGCREHAARFWGAYEGAKRDEKLNHQPQRILYAVCTVPAIETVESRKGPRWTR